MVRKYAASGTAIDEGFIATGAVELNSSKSYSLAGDGVDGLFAKTGTTTASKLTSVADSSITTAEGAQSAIAVIDKAISNIDSQRADLGAVQNRFDSTVSNLQSIVENSTAARSRIQDADFAAETAELTKQQQTCNRRPPRSWRRPTSCVRGAEPAAISQSLRR